MSKTKTNYIRAVLDDYCVLDTETTGLSSYYDEIIEIAIVKVRNNQIVDSYSTLVQPNEKIDSFITALTGITNEMLETAPRIDEIQENVLRFIGDDVIVGHFTNFDMRFLNAGFTEPVDNKYVDTLQFAKKLFPGLPNHKLSTLTSYLDISRNTHRALKDVHATKELYDLIKHTMERKNLAIKDLWVQKRYKHSRPIDISTIVPESLEIDEDNFFYAKHVVFTGRLEKMLRKDAQQIIVNLGGILDERVTKTTNYLILGNNDYCPTITEGKSNKQKKAEKLILAGADLAILDEFTFYDLINANHIENLD